jgi:hypothetical protein
VCSFEEAKAPVCKTGALAKQRYQTPVPMPPVVGDLGGDRARGPEPAHPHAAESNH